MRIKTAIAIISLSAVALVSTCQTPVTAPAAKIPVAVESAAAHQENQDGSSGQAQPAALKPSSEVLLIVETPIPAPPQVDAASMKVAAVDSNRAEIVITINMENPNVFEISPPTITYDYHLNRNSFIKGIIESENSLAASSVTMVIFRLFVNYSDLYRSYRQLQASALTEIPSFLTMTCDYENPDFTWEALNFELAGTLPLMRRRLP